MNNLQEEIAIRVIKLAVDNTDKLYDVATEPLRKKIKDAIGNVCTILHACGIDVPEEFWVKLEVWNDVPVERLADYVKVNIETIERLRGECDDIYNTLLRARRLLHDLTLPHPEPKES